MVRNSSNLDHDPRFRLTLPFNDGIQVQCIGQEYLRQDNIIRKIYGAFTILRYCRTILFLPYALPDYPVYHPQAFGGPTTAEPSGHFLF